MQTILVKLTTLFSSVYSLVSLLPNTVENMKSFLFVLLPLNLCLHECAFTPSSIHAHKNI